MLLSLAEWAIVVLALSLVGYLIAGAYILCRCEQNIRQERRRRKSTGPCIGNPSCVHNARNIYLQCAINPKGDCETCSDFKDRRYV